MFLGSASAGFREGMLVSDSGGRDVDQDEDEDVPDLILQSWDILVDCR